MCEQLMEQAPTYFKQFGKDFRYYVSEQYPNLPEDNFAISFHNPKSDACSISNAKHWHVLVYNENSAK